METWYGFPVLRFYFEGERNIKTLVLFLDGRKDEQFCVQYYVFGINTDEKRKTADTYFKSDGYVKVWDESSNTIRGYRTLLPDHQIQTMKELVARKLALLDKFDLAGIKS